MAHGTQVKFDYDNFRVRSFRFIFFFSRLLFLCVVARICFCVVARIIDSLPMEP